MSRKKPRPTPVPARTIHGLIDAHTHLASCKDDAAALVDRACAAGVDKLCTVGDGLAEAEAALAAAHAFPQVYAACAIHPTRVGELDQAAQARLVEMIADPRCVALRWHIDRAVEADKALMIHNREADADLLRVLADAPAPRATILHCFSSPLDVAREALDRGYVLSFAGNVTFKRNEELREAARLAPTGQVLIETDAPYMTPEPFRGSRNEPSLIGHTALCVAEARGLSPEELAEEISATFDRVYGQA